jgi:mono/diheme cytochrome c family protein
MLKPFLFLSAALVFAAGSTPGPTFALGATPQEATPPGSANPVKPTPASQERAKTLYTRDCALCHGDTGNGKTDLARDMQMTIPDWTDPKVLGSKSDQELYDIIRKGKDKMPAEDEGRAKKDEIWNLVLYIRAISKGQPAPAPPAPAPADTAPAPPPAPAPPTN